MRFPQLRIGQKFEYQGKQYTKTGPLTASELGTGTSAMIRRSAEVTLVEDRGCETPNDQIKQNYTRQEILELFQQYKSNLANQLRLMASDRGDLQLEPVLEVIDATLSLT
jgi:hypothetical protein